MLQYPKNISATIYLGWIPSGKFRTLEIFSKNKQINCDLEKQYIEIYEKGILKKKFSPKHEEPLYLELKEFIKCLKTRTKPRAHGDIGVQIVKIAETATKSLKQRAVVSFSTRF